MPEPPETTVAPLLEVRGLQKHFEVSRGLFGPKAVVRAVDGVSFAIKPKECFALVGESGCGKTTVGRLILALEKSTGGDVLFEGRSIQKMPASELRRARRRMQVIFQDPFSSLNPRMRVSEILEEPFIIHGLHPDKAERKKRILFLLEACGIARTHLERFPHEFSGGQRQRVGIARALALSPKLIVADEPVSALDVSIQAQILNLLQDLQKELGLTYLFISHDFSVVRQLADRIAVMYLGRIVELAPADGLFSNPQHPYTEALLSAVPTPDPEMEEKRRRIVLAGERPSPFNPPAGCHFHPRCGYAEAACKRQTPRLALGEHEHLTACPPAPFASKPSTAAVRLTEEL